MIKNIIVKCTKMFSFLVVVHIVVNCLHIEWMLTQLKKKEREREKLTADVWWWRNRKLILLYNGYQHINYNNIQQFALMVQVSWVMWHHYVLGEVEWQFTLHEREMESLSHYLDRGVVRQLQVVHTGHDRWQEVIRVLWVIHCLTNDSQGRIQGLKTWNESILVLIIFISALDNSVRGGTWPFLGVG